MKKISIILICLLLITGCSSAKDAVDKNTGTDTSSTDSLDDTFYPIVNLGVSVNRETIYTDYASTSDFQTIGRELQILSTEHFSTSDYYMSEGLQFSKTDKEQLMKRDANPEKYPYTLQSPKGDVIEGITDPVMVGNIYEQDYYIKEGNDYKLSGLAFAIVIDPREQDGNRTKALTTPMSDSTIKEFGKGTIEKLYKYLQSKKSLKNIPVNICVYQATETSESYYNGKYIYSCFCDGSLGETEELNYNMTIFTSDEATALDEDTSSKFAVFKNNLKNASTEAVGVIGYGRYKDGNITSMRIQMTVNVKTYTELIYMVQLAADELDAQFSGFDINVVVSDQDGLKAVIIKNAGEDAQSTLLY